MTLEDTDAASAANAKAPRVSLGDIRNAISACYYTTGNQAIRVSNAEHYKVLGLLTICIVVMKNGFTVIGKSAPASPENFKSELGEKFAYEDAIRQIWPLMGFALRERLHDTENLPGG